MKHTISIILAVLIVITVLPINSTATSTSERENAINMACELFPEHATIINNSINNESITLYRVERREKVFEETKDYSDSVAITYTEFSDGTAYVTQNTYSKEFTQTGSDILSSYLIKYTCNIAVYSNYASSKLCVNGIKFIIDSISYDNITSKGTITSDSVSNAYIVDSHCKMNEDSNGDAYTTYSGDFPRAGGTPHVAQVRFYVGQDRCYIDVF